MEDMRLISIWHARRPSGRRVNFHSHDYHELVYYDGGNGKTTIGDRVYGFSDGHFALIPPHVDHDEQHFADCRVICLEFVGLSDAVPVFGRDPAGAVRRILRDLLTEAETQPFGYRDMMTVKLNELHLHLLRSENTGLNEKNFEYIINYIRENYHEKIRLSDCARQLNLSYDYFQHKFKALTGLSPQQFLIRRRLEAAEALVRSGDGSCTEIAYRCGFSTSAQFSALFTREYGVSPLHYRKRAG